MDSFKMFNIGDLESNLNIDNQSIGTFIGISDHPRKLSFEFDEEIFLFSRILFQRFLLHWRHGQGSGEPDFGEQRTFGDEERAQHRQGWPHRQGGWTHRVSQRILFKNTFRALHSWIFKIIIVLIIVLNSESFVGLRYR